jgi:hypothetical protein
VRTEQGKLYLFVAIDRTSKFAYAQLHERATRRIAADFLRALEHLSGRCIVRLATLRAHAHGAILFG